MTRGSDSGDQKMIDTSIDSSKLDSLEARATAVLTILHQNWQGRREVENRWRNIRKNMEADGRFISTQYFYFSNINYFEKLSAAPN